MDLDNFEDSGESQETLGGILAGAFHDIVKIMSQSISFIFDTNV
jgi:hypothetical protein